MGPDGPHAKDCAGKACKQLFPCAPQPGSGGGTVTLRVLKAVLFRSFDFVGLMDPFAEVEYLPGGSEEKKVEIGRTKSAWGAHMHPVWEHMCRSTAYRGVGSGDLVRVRVSEENMGGLRTPTFCGEVTVQMEELLAGSSSFSTGVKTGKLQELRLVKRSENTGTVTVQALLHELRPADGHADKPKDAEQVEELQHSWTAPALVPSTSRSSWIRGHSSGCIVPERMTHVDPLLFEQPVQRLGVSGGTAPFFALKLRSPSTEAGESVTHWIGKDLSRATDEINFYEEKMELEEAGCGSLDKLLGFMFDYAGVVQCQEVDAAPDAPQLQLLVLRNLRDGCRSLRMLDIKVGEKTAAAGWQGKSWFAAMRQSVVDGLTNSCAEGFRLEGFDGEPPALQSMDPLMDFGGTDGKSRSTCKKARRIMMQRMHAQEMFAHLLDVHQEPPEPADVEASLTPTELAEIVMNEIVQQLVKLTVACRVAFVPQKWIGSSVALGFDSGSLPSRETAMEEVARTLRVNIFDWGRSELNTMEHHTSMSAEAQADRLEFWRYYSGGIDRLAWEAARFCWHRFGNTTGWSHVLISVFDFDSHSANDFIGQVELPLETLPEVSIALLDKRGMQVQGKSGRAGLVISVSWRDLPRGSRLRGVWRVHILRAENLPGVDFGGTSDPFVTITASSDDGLFEFRQSSCVVARNLNPVWDEIFELPVAKHLPILMESLLPTDVEATAMFPYGSADAGNCAQEEDHAKARELWSHVLAQTCGHRSLQFA